MPGGGGWAGRFVESGRGSRTSLEPQVWRPSGPRGVAAPRRCFWDEHSPVLPTIGDARSFRRWFFDEVRSAEVLTLSWVPVSVDIVAAASRGKPLWNTDCASGRIRFRASAHSGAPRGRRCAETKFAGDEQHVHGFAFAVVRATLFAGAAQVLGAVAIPAEPFDERVWPIGEVCVG